MLETIQTVAFWGGSAFGFVMGICATLGVLFAVARWMFRDDEDDVCDLAATAE